MRKQNAQADQETTKKLWTRPTIITEMDIRGTLGKGVPGGDSKAMDFS